MASASYGLRHPASASCLGRHLRLAGRCPNNSSLFPPLRRSSSLLAIFSGKIILNFAFVALCGALQTHFHERGRNGKLHLQCPLPTEAAALRAESSLTQTPLHTNMDTDSQKSAPPRDCFRRKPARQLPFFVTPPSREKVVSKRPQAFRNCK